MEAVKGIEFKLKGALCLFFRGPTENVFVEKGYIHELLCRECPKGNARLFNAAV